MDKKLIVIGLDGATFTAIVPLFKKGKLPFLKNLMKNGVFGKLESTIPPVSCPAWPSFSTGKNPTKHGVLDWHYYRKDYTEHFNSAKDIKGKRFWDYLNEAGLECGVINMPVSYPPYPIKGFMVAGFLADETYDFTYPSELKKEILEQGYRIDALDRYAISDDSFLEQARKVMEKRKEIILNLMKTKRWDVIVNIFRPEPIQHRFWKNGTMEIIEDTYERLDNYVKEIVNSAGGQEKVNVMLMSDHGFGDVPDYNFYFNRWLSNQGYFNLNENKNKLPLDKIYRVLVKMGLGWTKYLVGKKLDKIRFISYAKEVDWSKTKAFARISEDIGFIYLNKKERFEKGILSKDEVLKARKEIKDKLKDLFAKNERIILKIWDKEEMYGNLEIAPDLIFEINPKFRGLEIFDKQECVEIPFGDKRTWHNKFGIFIANGPEFSKGKEISGAKLIDLAPTILGVYGIKKPEDMDGKVLDIFKKTKIQE